MEREGRSIIVSKLGGRKVAKRLWSTDPSILITSILIGLSILGYQVQYKHWKGRHQRKSKVENEFPFGSDAALARANRITKTASITAIDISQTLENWGLVPSSPGNLILVELGEVAKSFFEGKVRALVSA